jgi:hypothetical protein
MTPDEKAARYDALERKGEEMSRDTPNASEKKECDRAYCEFRFVAFKRKLVPETVFQILGQLVLRQPFRWLFTRAIARSTKP